MFALQRAIKIGGLQTRTVVHTSPKYFKWNKVELAGNVVRDPVYRNVIDAEEQKGFWNFSVAVNKPKTKEGEERPPSFFNCQYWGKPDELQNSVEKGTKVLIGGKLDQFRNQEGQNVVLIKCHAVHVLRESNKQAESSSTFPSSEAIV